MPKGVYDRSNRPNKRGEILRAAGKVYGFYGFEGATIERIAAAAGVSKSLVIEHFGSKQELIRAVASRAVQENLERVRRIDELPGLTLWQREKMIFEIIKPAREEWCLILGTLLVPNFQFPMRGELDEYLQITHRAVTAHIDELIEPTDSAALAFAYSMICLHIGYVVAGREEEFRIASRRQLEISLRPEEEILAERKISSQDFFGNLL